MYKSDIKDIELGYYDDLVKDYCDDGYCPYARSGYIRLNIKRHAGGIYTESNIHNKKDLKNNRKDLIRKRLVEDGGLFRIKVFDENNWSKTIYGNFVASIDGDDILINAHPKTIDNDYSSNMFKLTVPDLNEFEIRKLELVLENCDYIEIFGDEIENINVKFNDELSWGSNELHREIVGGYIDLKIEYKSYRSYELFDEKATPNNIIKRLAGKKKEDLHDICLINVEMSCGLGEEIREQIGIKDTRPQEMIDAIEKAEDDDSLDNIDDLFDYPYFIGGVAKAMGGNKVRIEFGVFYDNRKKR
ncbi:MAG: hypothetical protein K6E87_06480 [bacterium]|nr:hypothetical protein [bacterium]